MRTIFSGASAVIGLALLPDAIAQAATLNVPTDYPTIQAGIDAASPGDTVLVAPGSYSDFSTRDGSTACVFLTTDVTLLSESGPSVTIIDCDLITGASTVAVVARDLAGNATRVEGFTIDGRSRAVTGCFVHSSGLVTLQDCVFRRVTDLLFSTGAIGAAGDLDLIGCTFEDCGTDSPVILHRDGHLEMVDCTVRNCGTGAVGLGHTSGQSESARFSGCQFIDNCCVSVIGGGFLTSADIVIEDCLFARNYGPGINLSDVPVLIERCVFFDNGDPSSSLPGGAVASSDNTQIVIRSNAFVDNHKQDNGAAGSAVAVGGGTIENNIFYGGSGGASVAAPGGTGTACNVFWANPDGPGITLAPTDREVDPAFCDILAEDFTLRQGSPCLPPGSLGCGLIGALPEGCGLIAVESTSWAHVKNLYRSDPD